MSGTCCVCAPLCAVGAEEDPELHLFGSAWEKTRKVYDYLTKPIKSYLI